MESTPVEAPPATGWFEPRPAALSTQLWADKRPTGTTVAELSLPAGAMIRGHDGKVLGWESAPEGSRGLGELWLSCARQFPNTGLWPICDALPLYSNRRWGNLVDNGRPYWRDPYALPQDVYDAANIADRSDYFYDPEDGPDSFRELLEDYDVRESSMTLAQASEMPRDPLQDLEAPDDPERLTLVACRRPADAVLLLDFGVPNDGATPGIFNGVLRSWETRFGVLPVMLRPDWTLFQVLAPPTDDTEIDRLSAEVFAFAIDSAIQGGFHNTYGDRGVGAREMVRSRKWLIWWD